MVKNLLEKCPLCGSAPPGFTFVKLDQKFSRCRSCQLIYQDPPPSVKASRDFYEEAYYEGFGEQNAGIQNARHRLYGDFLNHWRKSGRRAGRVLDIGSGHGDFLVKAREAGWEVWGIEPSRTAHEAARRLLGPQVFHGTIEEAEFPENHFDLITCWNVIDCLPDPVSSLRMLRQWLRPGGTLFVRTPNASFHWRLYRFYSRFAPLLKKMGWSKEASVFLRFNFNPKSLERLLLESGFLGIQVRNGRLTSGDPYKVFSGKSWMIWAKGLLEAAARALAFLTGNRLLISSNLMATASKGVSESCFFSLAMRGRLFLKSGVLHLLAGIGYLLGIPLWLKVFGLDRQIRILNYHTVSDLRQNDLNVQEAEFRKHLRFFKRHYAVLSLEEAVEALDQKELPSRPSLAITFDDGYRDNFEKAFPILKEENLPFAIFLLTGGEGDERRLTHLPGSVSGDPDLLHWEQVKEMSGAGMTAGSHGVDHVRLSELPEEALEKEIAGSKKKIENEISRPVEFFSYPYGTEVDFNRQTEQKVKEAGYRAAFSAIYGTNHSGSNRYALKRIGIEAGDTLFTLRAKLNGAMIFVSLFKGQWVRGLIRQIDSRLFKNPRIQPSRAASPILLASVDFPPHTDGVSTISMEMASRIAGAGKHLMVIGPRDRGDREFDRCQAYRVYRVPGYGWGYLRFLPMFFAFPCVVFRHRVQKVLAMNIAYGGVLSWILSHFCRLDYLIFAYGYEFEKVKSNPFLTFLYRKIYGRAHGIVSCSEDVKWRLVRFGGAPPEKILTLYPAVDLERFYPRPVPDEFLKKYRLQDKQILLSVSRLVERKGHDVVLRALPEIRKRFPQVHYLISGIGPHERPLRNLVRELGLERSVSFLGKVPPADLPLLYNACEIFLMPSREIKTGGHVEGFGIVFLEANACGKPVIGGKSGGILEAVVDHETGLLVDPDNPDDLREKILLLLSDPDQARKLGRQGFQWVRETFNWDRYTEKVLSLWRIQ